MKKVVIGVLFIFLICICSNMHTYAEGKEKLSELTEEKLVEKVVELGVVIPENFKDKNFLGEFVVDIVKFVEDYPDKELYYNISETKEFANDIRAKVLGYYEINENISTEMQSIRTLFKFGETNNLLAAYTLQHSTNFVEWSTIYAGQNCFGYAVGKSENLQVGQTLGMTVTANTDIQTILSMAGYDLRNMGYSNANSYTYKPTVPSGMKLICVRRGPVDYHFMKLDGSTWYHKPGTTSRPLKFKYTSETQVIWTNEGIDRYGTAYAPNTTYNSIIGYIIY